MNKFQFLLKKITSDKVRIYKLWEVTIWDKKFQEVEEHKQKKVIKYKYLLAKDLKNLEDPKSTVRLLSTGKFDSFTSEELAKDYISEGEIVSIPWGGNAIVKYHKGKFVTADNRIATSTDTELLSNKFLYYFLLEKTETINSFYRGSSIKHPSMKQVLEMDIPVPPLPIQEEIVRILDEFTELEAELETELETELEARTKQYDYYRNQLLDFSTGSVGFPLIDEMLNELSPEGVGLCRLTDIMSNLKKGTLKKTELLINGHYPVMNSGRDLYGKYNKFNNNGNVIVIASRGEYAGFVTYMMEDFWAGGLCYPYRSNNESKLLTKFAYHYLSQNQNIIMSHLVVRGSIPALNKQDIDLFEIPIPPLPIQEEIVKILDQFSEYTSSISQGLPAEIELRRKQYEYYRNKLLTF